MRLLRRAATPWRSSFAVPCIRQPANCSSERLALKVFSCRKLATKQAALGRWQLLFAYLRDAGSPFLCVTGLKSMLEDLSQIVCEPRPISCAIFPSTFLMHWTIRNGFAHMAFVPNRQAGARSVSLATSASLFPKSGEYSSKRCLAGCSFDGAWAYLLSATHGWQSIGKSAVLNQARCICA